MVMAMNKVCWLCYYYYYYYYDDDEQGSSDGQINVVYKLWDQYLMSKPPVSPTIIQKYFHWEVSEKGTARTGQEKDEVETKLNIIVNESAQDDTESEDEDEDESEPDRDEEAIAKERNMIMEFVEVTKALLASTADDDSSSDEEDGEQVVEEEEEVEGEKEEGGEEVVVE